MSIPTQVPAELVAGNTWTWERALTDYPSPTWVATWYFEMDRKTFNAVGSQSGTSHRVTVAAATTATLKPGRYRWWVRVTSGGEAYTPEEGELVVLVDPAAAGTTDTRSWARRTLDALEAAIEGRANADQLAMTVGGRSISRTPVLELMQWRDRLRTEVSTEEQGGQGRNIKVRFSRG